MITPPYHFAIASCPLGPTPASSSEILYRGAVPVARNLKHIERLGLKTLLYLRSTPLGDDDPVHSWATGRDVDLRWVKSDAMTEEKLGMGRSEVGEVLKIILDPSAYPLYIADIDGASHTTLIIACLRKLQGWHIDSIIGEICR
jgi:protein tyrosine/serine phosphatase